MCGIRNTRTAHAINDFRITAGAHFLVVIVMWIPHSRIARPRHKNRRSSFFYFTVMTVSKFVDLFLKSLYQVVSKKDIIYTHFLMNSIATSQLLSRHLTAITPGVTLLSKSSHACKLYVFLKSEKETFNLATPFCFNENTKRLAAHEIELRWNKFNIHKFPLQ